jgi:hypothetical protein
MSKNKFPSVQANKSKDKKHQVPEHLANNHYLLHLEKEQWNKGQKISTPEIRLVPVADYISFTNDGTANGFYENHGYTVEILHDPSLIKGEEDEEEDEEVTGETAGGKKAVVTEKAKPKKKPELLKEYAELMGIEESAIEKNVTIAQLNAWIAEENARVEAEKE